MEWINEEYAPNIGCSTCYKALYDWSKDKNKRPKYKLPMMWINPGAHNEENCYFCVNKKKGINVAKRKALDYVATDYVALPVIHRADSPVVNADDWYDQIDDQFSVQQQAELMEIVTETDVQQPSTSEYVPSVPINTGVRLISQTRFANICRRLELSQRKSRLLALMLKEDQLLAPDMSICSTKNRQAEFIPFFTTEGDLSFCSNINGLMEKLKIDYDVDDWRLFIDGSKSGLKAVLLHNDNVYMPIPIAYSTELKESHESMRLIFDKIKYNEHMWCFSGDLKVVALVMGLQLGRTKNSCFICTWLSTAKIDHYHATWEKRSEYEIGIMNVKHNSLVPREKILFPTLHIKLGLISSFIRKLSKDSEAFRYLSVVFPKLSSAKIAAGI